MNEKIDLTKILKNCPKGWKLYTPIFGDVELKEVDASKVYSVDVKLISGLIESFTREGKLYDKDGYKDTECVLFPSKEQRDWSKFIAPWYKKDKFDPNTLKPYDKVLVRQNIFDFWLCDHFSFMNGNAACKFWCASYRWFYCIPYNDETKHLVGTTDNAPEYYRHWEE